MRYWSILFDQGGNTLKIYKVRKSKSVVAQGLNMTVRNDGVILVANVLAENEAEAQEKAKITRTQYICGMKPCHVCSMVVTLKGRLRKEEAAEKKVTEKSTDGDLCGLCEYWVCGFPNDKDICSFDGRTTIAHKGACDNFKKFTEHSYSK